MMLTHRISICAILRLISEPFDNNTTVELKFVLPSCGEIAGGGDITLRIVSSDRALYMVGDQYTMQLTKTS